MRLIDADALKKDWSMADKCEDCQRDARDCRYGMVLTRMDVCEMLDDAPTVEMPGWISVKERMPEPNVSVLLAVYDRDHGFTYRTIAWLNTSGDWDSNDDGFNQGDEDVLYWCVLPEPPEEVSGNAD